MEILDLTAKVILGKSLLESLKLNRASTIYKPKSRVKINGLPKWERVTHRRLQQRQLVLGNSAY